MKTATVRDLRNKYTSLSEWLGAGEEIVITLSKTASASKRAASVEYCCER